jgi:CRP-like cAMP-binding protein
MDTLEPGSILGLPGAFNGEYSMSARAVEDSELGMIPVDKLMGLLESNPTLMRCVLELLAKDVAKMRSLLSKGPDRKRLRQVGKLKH